MAFSSSFALAPVTLSCRSPSFWADRQREAWEWSHWKLKYEDVKGRHLPCAEFLGDVYSATNSVIRDLTFLLKGKQTEGSIGVILIPFDIRIFCH